MVWDRIHVLGCSKAFCKVSVNEWLSRRSGIIRPFSSVRTSCPPLEFEEMTKSPIARASTVTLANGS